MAIRYRKFEPGEYVMQVRNGKTLREGPGLAVLYNTRRSSVLAVPTTAIDADFAFEDILTADFQACCVQGTVTYRFRDFHQTAALLDFACADRPAVQAEKRREALRAASTRLENLAKIALQRAVAEKDIRTALKSGDALGAVVRQALEQSPIVTELGVELLDVTLTGLSAKPETRRALEAAAREQILKEQDDAIYMRRNAAIEQERLVRENELDTEIRVAEKAREKKERELATERFVLEQELALEQERMESRIALEERSRALVAAEVENQHRRSQEQADAMAALMQVFETVRPEVLEALTMGGMDPRTLIARAFVEIGENAQRIGNLNVTPELLENLMVR